MQLRVDDRRIEQENGETGRVGIFDQVSNSWSPLARSRVAEMMMSKVGLGIFYFYLSVIGERQKATIDDGFATTMRPLAGWM